MLSELMKALADDNEMPTFYLKIQNGVATIGLTWNIHTEGLDDCPVKDMARQTNIDQRLNELIRDFLAQAK
jgi:hypothetical protein